MYRVMVGDVEKGVGGGGGTRNTPYIQWATKEMCIQVNTIPMFIWVTPNKIDIFILREFEKGNSEELPHQLGSMPNGYGSWYLIKPTVCELLIKAPKFDLDISHS